jgi:uncharacterized membrane protein YkvA (DUF1232 family)
MKQDIITLYFAIKHPQTPLYEKIVAVIVVGYALSPIDLIPDFIPLIGFLDEFLVLPAGIALTIKLLPADILLACREAAKNNPPAIKPKMWFAAYIIVSIWIYLMYSLYTWFK